MKRWIVTAVVCVAALGWTQSVAKASPIDVQMQVVASFYPKYLHRAPDSSGMRFWQDELRKGLPLGEIEARILASPEYLQIHGNSNVAIVRGMLGDVTGGPAHPQQLGHFVARLSATGSPLVVAREVLSLTNGAATVIVHPKRAPVYRPFVPGHSASHHGHSHAAPVIIPGRPHNQHVPPPRKSGIQMKLNFGF